MSAKRHADPRSGNDPASIDPLAIQPLQKAATDHPHQDTRALVRKRRICGNALARQVNDYLTDPTAR